MSEGAPVLGPIGGPLVERWYVYNLWCSRGSLLYIGMSVDPDTRIAEHRCQQPWADLIDGVTITGPYARAVARSHERATIAERWPLFNLADQIVPQWARISAYDALAVDREEVEALDGDARGVHLVWVLAGTPPHGSPRLSADVIFGAVSSWR